MSVNFLHGKLWKKVFLRYWWYCIYDTKTAVYCISLFNLDVKVIVLGENIYCIGKVLACLSLSFWSR